MTRLEKSIQREWLWAGVYVCAGVVFALVTGFRGMYGQDAYEYGRYADALREFIRSGTDPGAFFWPVNYPVAGALLGMPFGNSDFPLLLISLVSHALTFVLITRIIRNLFGDDLRFATSFGFVFVLLCPYLVRSSVLVMADSFAVMTGTAAFYFALRYRVETKPFLLILTFATVGLGAFTRYAAVIPGSVAIASAVFHAVRKKHWIPVFISAMCLLIFTIPHFYLNQGRSSEFLAHPWLQTWHPLHFFQSSFDTPDGQLQYGFPNAVFALEIFFHPGFIFPGIALAAVFLFRRKLQKEFNADLLWVCAGILAYLIFIAGMPIQNTRFLLQVFPLVAIVGYPAAEWIFSSLHRLKVNFALILTAGILIQAGLTGFVCRKLVQHVRLENQISAVLEKFPDKTLYSFSWEGALEWRKMKIRHFSIFANEVNKCESNALLLVQPADLESQWKDKMPGKNWEYFIANCKLKVINEFPEGWTLYEIE